MDTSKIDSVKIGLICITLICLGVGIAGLCFGADHKLEIALAAMNGVSVIGGWLGHAVTSGKDNGSTPTQTT